MLVFAGLIFGEKLLERSAVLRAIGAFGVFCLLSGVVYLINDIRDREADRCIRRNPDVRLHPGTSSPGTAGIAAFIMGAAGLVSAFLLGPAFGFAATIFLALLTLYSAWLKHIVILDALTISLGFVLRAIGGAVVINVQFSHWLLLLMLLLAMFLALSKRRAELVALADDARGHRRILAEVQPVPARSDDRRRHRVHAAGVRLLHDQSRKRSRSSARTSCSTPCRFRSTASFDTYTSFTSGRAGVIPLKCWSRTGRCWPAWASGCSRLSRFCMARGADPSLVSTKL